MEGLTGELSELLPIGHTRNGLALKIRNERNAQYSIRGFSHALGPERIATCAREWQSVHGDRLRVTVMGHSLGGGQALIKTADNLEQIGIQIDTLVSLDGRNGPERRCGDKEQPYVQPRNVDRVYNFRRCGLGLDGREWTGTHVQNFLVNSPHSSVPYNSTVHEIMGPVLTGPRASQVSLENGNPPYEDFQIIPASLYEQ
jgi:hypothetical protein